MDSMITRKDFCKNLAMSSVAAVAYPAPPVAEPDASAADVGTESSASPNGAAAEAEQQSDAHSA